MKCAIGLCGHCQFGRDFICKDGPVMTFTPSSRSACAAAGDLTWPTARKPKLAVWKFASCDGCQLTLLDCEDELLAVAGAVEIAYFLEATRGPCKGPYDLSLVEGSITTAHDAERISEVRRQSKALVTIGACATAGGIQALRNFADVDELHADRLCAAGLYLDARHLDADRRARAGRFRAPRLPDRQAPARRGDLRLPRRAPADVTPAHSVCIECKLKGNVCVMVAHGDALSGAGDPCRLRGAVPDL